MKLSRIVLYALQTTLQLAWLDSEAPVPSSQLAAAGKMPERFLLHVLRHLVAGGILVSTRGVDGGYALRRSPEGISLLEVIEAVDGPWGWAVPLSEGMPADSKAKLAEALAEVAAEARRELEAIKLSELMPGPRGQAVTE
jgi:Rrf2 family protein